MNLGDRQFKAFCIGSFMNRAGAQEALVRVASQLRARGHMTEVRFLYKHRDAFAGDPHVQAIRSEARLGLFGYASAFTRLLKELRQQRPDVVICFMPLGAIMGCLAAVLAGVRVRIASQRVPSHTVSPVMRLLDRLWGKTSLYTKIICVSDSVMESYADYSEAYRRKLSVVHNGIPWRGSSLPRSDVRDKFGLPQDALLFFAAGRMSYQKNYRFLLERVREVDGMALVIAGDGDERAAHEAYITQHGLSDRVFLLGALPHDDVVDLYGAVDIFIQTSVFEGQSNSTLEAMHASLPIIVSDIPTQRETLCRADGSSVAYIVPLDQPEAWHAALNNMIADPQERARLGREAQNFVVERFTLKAMIDGFENAIVESL
jgi:glycosyltransferase involved in cell wall biosynthesis